MAASFIIDRLVARAPGRVHQPALLMLAGQDRIVDNARTLAYFEKLASAERKVIEYPEGHHTLEFDPDPARYALDLVAWLDRHLQSSRVKNARPALRWRRMRRCRRTDCQSVLQTPSASRFHSVLPFLSMS